MLNRSESVVSAGEGAGTPGKDTPLDATVSEPAAAIAGSARGTRQGRRGRRIAYGVAAAVLLITLLCSGLAWQAATGSVSLDMLSGRMEAEIRSRLPADAIVTIGSTALSYRSGQGILLSARDVRLALPGMATVSARELSTVTTPAALLARQIELSSVAASGLEIGVSVAPSIAGRGTGAERIRGAAKMIMEQVAVADDLMRGAGIRDVVVRDAAVRILDHAGAPGPALEVTEANWRPIGDARSKAWLQVAEGNGAGWDLTLERSRNALGSSSVSIEVEGLPAAAFAPGLAADEGGAYMQSAITLQTRMVMQPDGEVSAVRGALSLGKGRLSFTGKDTINLVSAGVTFALGGSGDRLAIPSGEIRTDSGRLAFEGAADVSEAGSTTIVARIRGGALPTINSDEPVTLTGGGLLARFDTADGTLRVERFSLAAKDGAMSAIGQVSGQGLSFALSMTEMPVALARAFWPPFVADKTRAWFDANVRSGILGPASIQVALPPDHIGARGRDKILPSYALMGSLPFRDGEFSPTTRFPAIRGAAGTIGFGNATATITTVSGLFAIPGRGELDVAGTTLIVPELGRAQPRGDLYLQLAGNAAALAALADTPLGIAAKRGIKPEALTGTAVLSLDSNIPLYESDLAELNPAFQLALNGFSSVTPIDDRLIADANLVLEGSPESFTVKGEGMLDGIEASLDLILGSATPGQTDVTLSLDEAARERMGLDLGSALTGPVKASVKAGEAGSQLIVLDLKEARISLPPLGWEKGPDVPATAHFTLLKSAEGTRITDLLLSGKGFGAKGTIALGPDGKLREAILDDVALRSGDSLSIKVTPDGGGFDVSIAGGALDARGILRGLSDGLGGGGAIGPIDLAIDVAEVRGQSDVLLTGLHGSLRLGAKGLETVSLKGKVNAAEPFEWELGRDGDVKNLRVFANDGGALIRFAGIYSKVIGGNLVVDYSGAAGGSGTGVMMLRDFRLLGESALAPAVETARQASNDRGLTRVERTSSSDISFTQLRIPFRQDDWIITIDDAALRGPMLGATASGTVNLPGKALALSGTFIPAFGINNIAGALPLIGIILGGGRDEGLVGITYKLFGPLDAPKLTMNPISAIAPGIFRKIFEYN